HGRLARKPAGHHDRAVSRQGPEAAHLRSAGERRAPHRRQPALHRGKRSAHRRADDRGSRDPGARFRGAGRVHQDARGAGGARDAYPRGSVSSGHVAVAGGGGASLPLRGRVLVSHRPAGQMPGSRADAHATSGEPMESGQQLAKSTAAALRRRRVLIIVENLPCPFDRRVWQEACTLRAAGYEVSIICPKGKGYERHFEEIDGIAIWRHPQPFEGDGPLGYAAEYAWALLAEFVLSLKVLATR